MERIAIIIFVGSLGNFTSFPVKRRLPPDNNSAVWRLHLAMGVPFRYKIL